MIICVSFWEGLTHFPVAIDPATNVVTSELVAFIVEMGYMVPAVEQGNMGPEIDIVMRRDIVIRKGFSNLIY